jgi:tRNA-2-methylthio-N6-dimethylallyladenosine synthase
MVNDTNRQTEPQKVYLETMGCQMNKLDSELVLSQLTQMGYELTEDSDEAGVVVYNTCSVRQHAEDKVISKIGQIKHEKARGREVTLAVIGCMAQRMGPKLLEENPQVDIACGPGQIHQLGEKLRQRAAGAKPLVIRNSKADLDRLEELDAARQIFDQRAPFSAYVRVIRGCSKFCHFCVVPFTRGLEHSRPIDNVFEETKKLVHQGVKEITLLGQTVNSYHFVNGRSYNLADVMERIHDLDGLERIRFVTNYPCDFHPEIMQAMAALPKACEYLHMPAQHGSDAVLKRMNRHYDRGHYVDLIAKYRETVPNISIASDIIVGYSGETDAEFAETMSLLEEIRFKNNYIFQYSVRPKTQADRDLDLPDDVPREVKKRRNHQLLELQNKIAKEDNQRFIGQSVEILVEGPSKKPHLNTAGDAPITKATLYDTHEDQQQPLHSIENLCRGDSRIAQTTSSKPDPDTLQLVGRTRGDYIVVFNGPKTLAGQLVNVTIHKASAVTLFGTV